MRYLLLLLILASCSPSTITDLRLEAEAEIRKISAQLHKIESKEDLRKATPRLKKKFNKLGDLLVEAREFKEVSEPMAASEELFIELSRIYEIPGGRESIEIAQSGAVRRLLIR